MSVSRIAGAFDGVVSCSWLLCSRLFPHPCSPWCSPSLSPILFLSLLTSPPPPLLHTNHTHTTHTTHAHTHTHSGLGIALLAVMAFVVQGGIPAPYATDWRIVAPIFVLRTALINCAQPLRKTMLNDFVPKDQRGRWNSLDSFRRMGWSGRYVVSRQRSNHFTRVQAISWRRCLLSALPSLQIRTPIFSTPLPLTLPTPVTRTHTRRTPVTYTCLAVLYWEDTSWTRMTTRLPFTSRRPSSA